MLMTKETIDQLAGYLGSTPIPEDFDTFWAARMAEADQVSLDYSVSPSEIPAFDTCDYLDFWFRGMNGARLYAKYVKPRSDRPIPLVLQFHGYPGASRSWLEQSSYAGMGCALLALDCPGQGGLGDDPGGYAGTTVTGHIVAGLDGPPERMYYVRLHQNIRVLCRIVRELEGIDQKKIYINGASQGGGIGIACAALNPASSTGRPSSTPFSATTGWFGNWGPTRSPMRACATTPAGSTPKGRARRHGLPS